MENAAHPRIKARTSDNRVEAIIQAIQVVETQAGELIRALDAILKEVRYTDSSMGFAYLTSSKHQVAAVVQQLTSARNHAVIAEEQLRRSRQRLQPQE